MSEPARPISFRDYLPQVFRANEVNEVSFFSKFLKAFEALFEGLEAEIEGKPDRTSGGIADLFDPATTPPPQFQHRALSDFDFLNYLASWIALPLREEKSKEWNQEFFKSAIQLYNQRCTLPGMEAMLRCWLKGELIETDPPVAILTDLTRTDNDVDAVFQLAPANNSNPNYAQLGFNTNLGEGPPHYFIADLIIDPENPDLRNPIGLDMFQRAARFMLDLEKPAHTYYQLRIRAHGMQLAPE